jgi:hypothetical protein
MSGWAVPENRGGAQTLHGALDVTRNAVCSPHAHHLAQHCEHEEKPQQLRNASRASLILVHCPVQNNSQSEKNPVQDEEEFLTH